MKRVIFLSVLILPLSGCIQPSEEMIRPINAETELANVYATKTEQAKATATPTVTLTPKPTKTPNPTNTPIPPELLEKTKQARTQEAISAQKTEIAMYKEIDWRDLTTYTEKHIMETVHIWGKVFNINSDQEMQIWINNSNEAVYIFFPNSFSDIYEGDLVDVYGFVREKYCGTNAFGGEVCQPLILASILEKR